MVGVADLPVIDVNGLRALVPVTSAIVALEAALYDGSAPGTVPARSGVCLPTGQLMLAPAANDRYTGIKLVSVAPGNPALGFERVQGAFLLLDTATLTPRALIDATALTWLRTPALSAVALRHLAVQGPVRLVVIGTGPQAYGHIEAVAAIRPLVSVTVAGRDRGRAAGLAAWCHEQGWPTLVLAGSDLPDDLADPIRAADVVICATSARQPLFPSSWVADHTAVVAVGSNEPDAREVDSDLVRRATVVVETVETAWREAGDLAIPLAAGEIGLDGVAGDLAALVRGQVAVTAERPRLFKSVGQAWEDLVIAAAAFDALVGLATEQERGRPLA